MSMCRLVAFMIDIVTELDAESFAMGGHSTSGLVDNVDRQIQVCSLARSFCDSVTFQWEKSPKDFIVGDPRLKHRERLPALISNRNPVLRCGLPLHRFVDGRIAQRTLFPGSHGAQFVTEKTIHNASQLAEHVSLELQVRADTVAVDEAPDCFSS